MSERTIAWKIRAEYAGYKSAMADVRAESRKTAQELDRDGNKITTTSGRIIRSAELQRESWDRSGRALVAFGAAGAAALALSARSAIEWESAWAGVLKTVDGSHDQLAQLEDDLRKMALRLPASSTEIAAVAEAAGQLGVKVQDVAAFTETMINLGETTNLSAEEAATALARVANIMGTLPGDINRLGSTIVELGNNSATTEAEIVGMATRLAAASRQAGLSEAQMLAFASALTSVGVEAEAGGTAMSKVFTAISDAVRTGNEDLSTFARVSGVSVAEFKRLFEQDASQAIALFVESLGAMSAAGESTTAVFDELGLTDQRLMRAVLSLGSAQGLLTDQLALANEEWASGNALAEEAAKRYDTTEAKLQIARNALNEAAITIGEDLLPMLAAAAAGTADLVGWFTAMPAPTRAVITGVAGVTSAVALLGGATLLTVPRLVETVKALEDIGAISPRAARGLLRTAGAAGKLGLAAVAAATALWGVDQAQKASAESSTVLAGTYSESVRFVLDYAEGLANANEELDKMGLFSKSQNPWEWLTTGGKHIDDISDALAALEQDQKSVWGKLGDYYNRSTQFWTDADIRQAEEIFKTFDQGFTSLAQSGNLDEARAGFERLRNELGVTSDELLEFLPEYADALQDVENEQRLNNESTADLADTTKGYASTLEEVLSLQRELAGQALNQREALRNYEQAIDDATAAVRENGRTLDVTTQAGRDNEAALDDLAAAIHDNVEAQSALTDGGYAAKDAMVAGREAFIRAAEKMGLAKDEAIDLADKLGLIPADIPVDVNANFVNAMNDVDNWINQMESSRAISIPIRATTTPGGARAYADGGPIVGPGTARSDSIPIWASNGEYMQQESSHRFWGTQMMNDLNARNVSGVWRALAARGFADGGSVSNITYGGSSSTVGDTHIHMTASISSLAEMAQIGTLMNYFENIDVRARQGVGTVRD